MHFNDVSVWTMIGSLVFDIHWTLSLCLSFLMAMCSSFNSIPSNPVHFLMRKCKGVNLNRKVGFEELGGVEWESECGYIM